MPGKLKGEIGITADCRSWLAPLELLAPLPWAGACGGTTKSFSNYRNPPKRIDIPSVRPLRDCSDPPSLKISVVGSANANEIADSAGPADLVSVGAGLFVLMYVLNPGSQRTHWSETER